MIDLFMGTVSSKGFILRKALQIAPVAQGIEQLPSKQGVAGSNPAVSTSSCVASVCDGSPPPESGKKANAHPLADAAEAFLLTKRIAGCTDATLQIYGWWLRRLQTEVPTVTQLAMRTFFVGLQHRSASYQHQA
jgi:hypothetical protein